MLASLPRRTEAEPVPRVLAWLARQAYAWGLRALLPLYFLRLQWRARTEAGYGQHLGERLGSFAGIPVHGHVWVHAVSLGETRACAPLLEALRRQRPGVTFLLTHGTATGREAGAVLLHEGDVQAWLPYDIPGAVRRFLRTHRPAAGVLMETEIWPVLLHEARAAGVPMLLANARLSRRSQRKGDRLRALLHPAAAALTRTLAQTVDDAERLRASGAHPVIVMGNLKFDLAPNPKLVARGLQWRQRIRRPVVIAASTREGEEAMLLDAWAAAPAPRPLLLVVPRHPQRFDAVAALVTDRGLRLARRHDWVEAPPEEALAADVWLGDTLGEMPLYYGTSDVALLGGSFGDYGGQNLIEAAACGCPLVLGPHTYNFMTASRQALACGAAVREPDMGHAVPRAIALAADPQRNERVQRALDFAASHRGAAARMADAVLKAIDAAPRRAEDERQVAPP
jgi:3-deoxy-D-manno-octulosonic-acid transferase